MKITFVDDETDESATTDAAKRARKFASVPAHGKPEPGMGKRHKPTPEGDALNPTRYLDWEKNGQCIDF